MRTCKLRIAEPLAKPVKFSGQRPASSRLSALEDQRFHHFLGTGAVQSVRRVVLGALARPVSRVVVMSSNVIRSIAVR